ncbi:hypothetical protein CRG98_003917 [Punica granatum]|uniref:Uncharacterized protein n=1 Tax=Punica granatum TaxID=22663 RepID=A0A2I0L4N6_PUNGR|nr:hypothetical protein CRG98_003917 [Punica granatum]
MEKNIRKRTGKEANQSNGTGQERELVKANSVLWLEWPEGQHCEDGGENRRRSGCEKKAKRASERAHECQEGTKQPW